MEVIMKRTNEIIDYKGDCRHARKTVATYKVVVYIRKTSHIIISPIIIKTNSRCVSLCQLIAFLRLHRIFAILNFFTFLSSYFFMDSYIFLYIERSKCTIIYIIIYNNIYNNIIIILIYKYKIFEDDITLSSCCPTLPHFPLRYKGKMNSYTRPFHSGSNGCFGLNKRRVSLSSTNIYIFYKLYF